MATQQTRYLFSVAEYEQMIAAGVFDEDARIELIEGEIVAMAAVGIGHSLCITAFDALLHRLLGATYLIFVQNPIRLPTHSEPQPDLAVIARKKYTETPGVADILFVVEVGVADSTILTDRADKLPLYARAGIPEAWLVDLNARVVERHTDPRDGVYQRVAFAHDGETLASVVIPAVRIPATDLFD